MTEHRDERKHELSIQAVGGLIPTGVNYITCMYVARAQRGGKPPTSDYTDALILTENVELIQSVFV